MKALPVLIAILGLLPCRPAQSQKPLAAQNAYASETATALRPAWPTPYERNASKLNATTSVDLRDVPPAEALRHITDRAGLLLVYGEEEVPAEARVSLDLSGVTVLEALHETIRGRGLKLQISRSGHLIVSRAGAGQAAQPSQEEPSLEHEVSGTVTSEDEGEPLPGVNVVVKGAAIGAVTDVDGTYRLEAPSPTDTLVFSYVGFLTREEPIAGRATVDVALATDDIALDEIVVVGYGTQLRRDLTGSVGSIGAEKIEELPVLSIDRALAGQLADVTVRQTSGQPGGGLSINIRGQGSIGAGNEPLYVVDGFPLMGDFNRDNNPLNFLNPQHIQSIEVLKDASAAAIYGSRGANGVVLITTKNGRPGEARFSFESYYGTQNVLRKVDVLNGQEWAEGAIESRNHAYLEDYGAQGATAADTDADREALGASDRYWTGFFQEFLDSGTEGTDWQDALFRSAPIRSYQLTATGGTEDVQYFVSGGYQDQQGVVINTGFERYSLRANLTARLSERMTFGFNLTPSYTLTNHGNVEGRIHRYGIVTSGVASVPVLPVRYDDGTYSTAIRFGWGIQNNENPVNKVLNWEHDRNDIRVLGTTYVDYELLSGLSFRSTFGGNIRNGRHNEWFPSVVGRWSSPPPTNPYSEFGEQTSLDWVVTNQLTYDGALGEAHELNVMVAQEAQRARTLSSEVEAENYPTDEIKYVYDGALVTDGETGLSEWSLLSFFGRLDYAFRDKYLFQFNLRADGASRFGADNRWGTFPAVSLGWVLSEEPFLRGLPGVDFLKVRGSYGQTGNFDIGNYAARGLMGAGNYVTGTGTGGVVSGFRVNRLSNPSLTWEKQEQVDVGLELELFDHRVAFTADWYQKTNDGLLLDVPVPRTSGFATELRNLGAVQNRGVEFSLETRSYLGPVEWTASANLSANRNEVLQLGPEEEPIYGGTETLSGTSITEVGQPFAQFYGYNVLGVFATQEEADAWAPWHNEGRPNRAGWYQFEDVDGDGIISPEDRTVLGSPWPDFTYGLSSTFAYKGLDLSLIFQGVQGAEILNGMMRESGDLNFRNNQFQDMYEGRWISEEEPGDGMTPLASRSAPAKQQPGNTPLSNWVEDASYFALRNVTLGYVLPQRFVERTGRLRSARLYLTVNNAFMLTGDYRGYNPEASVTGSGSSTGYNTLAPGIEYGTYPLARTFTLGANISF